MEKYLTEEANKEFEKMENAKMNKRVLLRMLAFVDDRIQQSGNTVSKKLIERRALCEAKYQRANFICNQSLYMIGKLQSGGKFLK